MLKIVSRVLPCMVAFLGFVVNLRVVAQQSWDNTEAASSKLAQLNDRSFQATTQASPGMTTGHWIILVDSNDCPPCPALKETMKMLGRKLKETVNVGVLNMKLSGKTMKRFDIDTAPYVFALVRGKLYRYKGVYPPTVDGLTKFVLEAEGGEDIPRPRQLFQIVETLFDYVDDGYKLVQEQYRSSPTTLHGVAAGGALLFVLLCIYLGSTKAPVVGAARKRTKKMD